MLRLLWFLFSFVCLIICAPKQRSNVPSDEALSFMKRFGYIVDDGPNIGSIYTDKGMEKVIKNIQKFGAIEQTGLLDNATMKLMKSKRCGVPDIIRSVHRRKRFILGPSGWEKRNITYFIANWTPRLGEQIVEKNIKNALNTWAAYGRLHFSRTFTPDADIIVAFGRGEHGDSFAFDGPGNVLAHAFFPTEYGSLGGDLHFDDDEQWTDLRNGGATDGTDFYTVALHELGHSLGLAHSPIPSSIMFPYYVGVDPGQEIQLDYDDILAMYKLYITKRLKEDDKTTDEQYFDKTSTFEPRTTRRYYETETTTIRYPEYSTRRIPTETTMRYPETTRRIRTKSTYYPTYPRTRTEPTTSRMFEDHTITYEGDHETVDDHKRHDGTHKIPHSNSPSLPNICHGNFDAVASLREELFIFKDQYVWRLRKQGYIEKGYPVTIYQMFPTLPDRIKKIDAAYQRPNGMIVLFTGREIWINDGRSFVDGSPKSLDYFGLPNNIDSIDAVQNWARNGKTYFYKNDRFWRYNETSRSMDEGYPMYMKRWRGVPEYLDAVTTWKGITYFFKGDLFWKFDNNWVSVTEHSPFPTAQIWLRCPEDEERMRRHHFG